MKSAEEDYVPFREPSPGCTHRLGGGWKPTHGDGRNESGLRTMLVENYE